MKPWKFYFENFNLKIWFWEIYFGQKAHRESELTREEKKAVDFSDSNEQNSNDDQVIGTIKRVLKESSQVQQRNSAKSKYRSTGHVAPTSNIVGRLFSLSKDIMKPSMRQMDPSALDSRVMLRLNKDLWDVYTVQECISEAGNVTPTLQLMPISGLWMKRS